MDYEVKKGHFKELEGDGLKSIMSEAFGSVSEEGGSLVSSFGALARIEARVVDKNRLSVSTFTDPKVSSESASETIRRYNMFLEKATGFTSKQRRDRLQKKAKEGEL